MFDCNRSYFSKRKFCNGPLMAFIFITSAAFGFDQNDSTLAEKRDNVSGFPRVTKIQIWPKAARKKGKENIPSNHAIFGDTLYITVENLQLLLPDTINNNPILLYINGNKIEGILPIFRKKNDNPLIYVLERNEASNDAWNKIFRQTDILRKNVVVTVGLKNGKQVAQSNRSIIFILRSTYVAVATGAIVLLIVVVSIYLAMKKDLLKDDSNAAVKTYSLSRTQLFFWTSIIVLSYIFIWFVCDDMNSIDTTALVLLGISAGTAAAAKMIDTKDLENKDENMKDKNSQGFWNDLLSDGKSSSMHRYQIILFTIVIGMFYVVNVLENYKMPVLSETVLILMGISSATYATLKTVESKTESKTASEKAPESEPDTTGSEESTPAVG